MDFLVQLFAFIVTILVLVSFHEAGHFVVAKLLGVKVLRFSIGFGKPLYRWYDKSGTEYVVAMLPLGGYVKLLDERELIVPELEKHLAFNRQPLWSRTLIVLAGPATNFLFAIFGFWLMFIIGIETMRPIIGSVAPNSIAAQAGMRSGDEIYSVDGKTTPSLQKVVFSIITHLGNKYPVVIKAQNIYTHEQTKYILNVTHWRMNSLNPDPLESLGLEPYRPPLPAIIEEIDLNSPAAAAGLKPKDKILKINNQSVPDWYAFVHYIHFHPGQHVALLVERNDRPYQIDVTIAKTFGPGFRSVGYMGVGKKQITSPPWLRVMRQYSPIPAFKEASLETWNLFAFNFIVLKKMIWGQIPLSSLGGPISIFRTADIALRQGIAVFLGFLALISVMLAFINILPIPGLDGGHLLNNLIELIIRRPLSLKYELTSIRIGMFLLVLLMLLATLNDILRLFTS